MKIVNDHGTLYKVTDKALDRMVAGFTGTREGGFLGVSLEFRLEDYGANRIGIIDLDVQTALADARAWHDEMLEDK